MSAPDDERSVAIERAVEEIEQELHQHFGLYERIAVTQVLERLAADSFHNGVAANWFPPA